MLASLLLLVHLVGPNLARADAPAPAGPSRLALQENALAALRDAIDAADHSVDLVVYKLDERGAARALERALERGVRVRVVADRREAMGGRSYLGKLGSQGADVRLWRRGKLHAKFVIIDGSRVMTGSYNLTESAQHDNLELAIDFADAPTIARFQALFEQLWDSTEVP